MTSVHFPVSTVLEPGAEPSLQGEAKSKPRIEDWRMSALVFKPDRVQWAINSFKPFKTGGEDKIFPALLQQGRDHPTTGSENL